MAVSSVTASTKARSSFLNDFKAAVELGAAKEGQAISTYLRSQSNSLLKQWEKLASAKLDTDERPLSEYMFETFVNRILSNHMGKAELETLRQRYYNTFLPIVWMSDEQRKRLHGSPNREGSTDRWGIRVLKATRSVDGVGEVAHLIDKEVIGPWNTNDTSRALSNLADISFVFYCRYEDWPQSHQQAFLPTMCNLYDLRNAIACEVTDVHNLEYSVGDFQHLAKMAHFDHLSHVLALVGVSRCAQIAWTRKAKGNWVTHQQGANAGVARCFLESPNPIYSLVALRAGMNLSIGLEKPSTMELIWRSSAAIEWCQSPSWEVFGARHYAKGAVLEEAPLELHRDFRVLLDEQIAFEESLPPDLFSLRRLIGLYLGSMRGRLARVHKYCQLKDGVPGWRFVAPDGELLMVHNDEPRVDLAWAELKKSRDLMIEHGVKNHMFWCDWYSACALLCERMKLPLLEIHAFDWIKDLYTANLDGEASFDAQEKKLALTNASNIPETDPLRMEIQSDLGEFLKRKPSSLVLENAFNRGL